jgi:hypothetical protein
MGSAGHHEGGDGGELSDGPPRLFLTAKLTAETTRGTIPGSPPACPNSVTSFDNGLAGFHGLRHAQALGAACTERSRPVQVYTGVAVTLSARTIRPAALFNGESMRSLVARVHSCYP